MSCKRNKESLWNNWFFLVYKEIWWFTSNCFLHVFRNALPLSILNCQIKIKYLFFIAISQEKKNCKKRKTTIQSITLVHYLEAGASKMFRSTTRATLKSIQDMNIRLGISIIKNKTLPIYQKRTFFIPYNKYNRC